MRLTAKFDGTCPDCGGPIRYGQSIHWLVGGRAAHAECPPGNKRRRPDDEPPKTERQVSVTLALVDELRAAVVDSYKASDAYGSSCCVRDDMAMAFGEEGVYENSGDASLKKFNQIRNEWETKCIERMMTTGVRVENAIEAVAKTYTTSLVLDEYERLVKLVAFYQRRINFLHWVSTGVNRS